MPEAKIVDIYGGHELPNPGEPNRNVVDLLERALNYARAGEMKAIAFAGVMQHEKYLIDSVGDAYLVPLIGATHVLEHELCEAYERSQGH